MRASAHRYHIMMIFVFVPCWLPDHYIIIMVTSPTLHSLGGGGASSLNHQLSLDSPTMSDAAAPHQPRRSTKGSCQVGRRIPTGLRAILSVSNCETLSPPRNYKVPSTYQSQRLSQHSPLGQTTSLDSRLCPLLGSLCPYACEIGDVLRCAYGSSAGWQVTEVMCHPALSELTYVQVLYVRVGCAENIFISLIQVPTISGVVCVSVESLGFMRPHSHGSWSYCDNIKIQCLFYYR